MFWDAVWRVLWWGVSQIIWGKKKVLMLSDFYFRCISCRLRQLHQPVKFLHTARFFTGLGLGAAMPTMISVVGDEATDANRGTLK